MFSQHFWLIFLVYLKKKNIKLLENKIKNCLKIYKKLFELK